VAPEPAAELGIIRHWLDPTTRAPHWTIHCPGKDPVRVEIQTFPETHVAYVRYIGKYQGQLELFTFTGLFAKLARWAEPRGLLRDPAAKWLTICHDNPELTEDDKLRVSVCLTVMGGWLPESGYQPDDRPCFELYLNSNHSDCAAEQSDVDLCVPVRPL
jgi:AraC family transcriptional regulator